MRLYLAVCLILFGFGHNVSLGESGNFEYECDILQRLEKLEDQNAALTKQLQDKVPSGSTYIRWGRTSCPGNGSELVYHGVAGGSYYEHTGAAANYLCLPLDPDPIYAEYEDTLQPLYSGLVYGAEYQLKGRSNNIKFLPHLGETRHQDVPCAVCRVARATMIMIPARNMCVNGWTLEYKGYLVSGQYNDEAASEYVCVDDEAEIIDGGMESKLGKLRYFVEGRCGSLPCPPYVDGRELTCAVCTK